MENTYTQKVKFDKEIKVMHVIDHMGLGGAQTIVKKLIEKNPSHRVFALKQTSNEIEFSKKDNERIYKYQSKGKYDLSSVFALRKEIKKHKPDILQVHLQKANFIVYLYKALFKDKIRVIICEHAAIFSEQKKFYRFILRRLQKHVDLFVGVSNEAKKALIQNAKINPQKVMAICNYLDYDDAKFLKSDEKTNLRKKLGFEKDDFLIGFVGRVRMIKNVDTLINSYQYLKDDKKIKIVIMGDGDTLDEMKELAKGEKNIHFLGYRTDAKILFQILDVVVLPSTIEASPMVLFESQVYGIPFVGSNIRSICEFVKDGYNGLIFRLKDEKDLAEKIMLVRKDKKLREELKKNSIENVKQFDFRIYMKKWNEIYNR